MPNLLQYVYKKCFAWINTLDQVNASVHPWGYASWILLLFIQHITFLSLTLYVLGASSLQDDLTQ